jgi:hypothetical protein
MSCKVAGTLLFAVGVLALGNWLLFRTRPPTVGETATTSLQPVDAQPPIIAKAAPGTASAKGASTLQGLGTTVPHALKPSGEAARVGRPLVPLTVQCTLDWKCGDCRTAADCPTGQGCMLDYEARKFLCLSSNCKTEQECAEGQVCLSHASATGPTIRRCAEAGLLQEGAECIDPGAPPEGRCALGMVCVLDRCGRQCDARSKQPCTGKGSCITMEGIGSGCFPSCSNDSDCDFGKACRRNGSVAECVQVFGPQCSELHCKLPFKCEGNVGDGLATYECVTSCNPLFPDAQCPEGFVCGAEDTRSRCYQRCTSPAVNDCPSGRGCVAVVEDGSQFGCVSSVRIRPILAPAETGGP